MNMMVYVMLLVGFVLLIKGADFFVEASSSVARMLRVPSIIIGLTIVAMGTSAPEAAVSISAAMDFPKRRGRLTHKKQSDVPILSLTDAISSVLSI